MMRGYSIGYFPPCGADTIARLAASQEIARIQRWLWNEILSCDILDPACECFGYEAHVDGVHHVELSTS